MRKNFDMVHSGFHTCLINRCGLMEDELKGEKEVNMNKLKS